MRTMTAAALVALGTAAAPLAQAEEIPAAVAPVQAGWDKGFFIRSADGDYGLQFHGLLQARYTYERLDEPDGAKDESNFSIPRARITLAGNLFGKDLTWKFQADFGKGFTALKDYYAEYAIVPHWLHVRAGQWKRPFSRQQMTSASKIQFVDREITDSAFGAGRDLGVAFSNDYEKSPTLEWAVGVFNGAGEKGTFSGTVSVDAATLEGKVSGGKFNNVPHLFNPTLVARVGFNHGGIKGYSEADLEGGPFRIGVAASGLMEFDVDDDGQSSIRGEVDTIMKVEGFSLSAAGFVASRQDGSSFADRSFQALGAHAQAGYVIAGVVEPLFRYGIVAPEGSANDEQAISGGVAVYFFGQNLKWVTDVTGIMAETEDGDRTDVRLRSQLQLAY